MKLVDSNVLALEVVPVSDEVAERAIELRRWRRMSLGDSIIAATALVEGIPLVTHNVSDFTGIADLQVEDLLPKP